MSLVAVQIEAVRFSCGLDQVGYFLGIHAALLQHRHPPPPRGQADSPGTAIGKVARPSASLGGQRRGRGGPRGISKGPCSLRQFRGGGWRLLRTEAAGAQ